MGERAAPSWISHLTTFFNHLKPNWKRGLRVASEGFVRILFSFISLCPDLNRNSVRFPNIWSFFFSLCTFLFIWRLGGPVQTGLMLQANVFLPSLVISHCSHWSCFAGVAESNLRVCSHQTKTEQPWKIQRCRAEPRPPHRRALLAPTVFCAICKFHGFLLKPNHVWASEAASSPPEPTAPATSQTIAELHSSAASQCCLIVIVKLHVNNYVRLINTRLRVYQHVCSALLLILCRLFSCHTAAHFWNVSEAKWS